MKWRFSPVANLIEGVRSAWFSRSPTSRITTSSRRLASERCRYRKPARCALALLSNISTTTRLCPVPIESQGRDTVQTRMKHPTFARAINNKERVRASKNHLLQAPFKLLKSIDRDEFLADLADNRKARPAERTSQFAHCLFLPRISAQAD